MALDREIPASIKITPLRATVTPNDWVHYHHPICFFQVDVAGPIQSVTVDLAPKGWDQVAMFAVWEKQEGGVVPWAVKRLLLGSPGNMAYGETCNTTKCKIEPRFHDNGGWWAALPGTWDGVHSVPVEAGTHYIFALYPRTADMQVMTVKGTGAHADLQQTVHFHMTGTHPHPGD